MHLDFMRDGAIAVGCPKLDDGQAYINKLAQMIAEGSAMRVVDPTGCGDAYRAGLLYGLMNGLDWETTGRIASLLGAIKIATVGTQHHRFTLDEFRDRFHEIFGYRME